MFQRILVPLDGSARAERALPVAGRIARATRGTVVLVEVLSAAGELLPYLATALTPSTQQADEAGAAAYLDAVAGGEALAGVPVERQVHTGGVAGTVLHVAETVGADLLVLASHGHSGLAHWPLGSVAAKLARGAACPVLVVRAAEEDGAMPFAESAPRRGLLALDGSPTAEEALSVAAQVLTALAAPASATLLLAQITAPGAETASSTRYLEGVAARLRGEIGPESQLAVEWVVAAGLDAARALMDLATGEQTDAVRVATSSGPLAPSDLLAVASHGSSGLHLWPLGSVSERVVERAEVPVLVVRTAAADR